MIVGIVGLGLIGASFAKAYKESGHFVYGLDTDKTAEEYARISGTIDDSLCDRNIPKCDLILLAVYPQAAVEFVKAHAEQFSENTLVMDCCGTKRVVCEACFPIAAKYGFTFVGGHPMAGTHHSGIKYSRKDLFVGSPMVVVPPDFNNIQLLEKIKVALQSAKFGSLSVTTAEKHDEMIAFTSQMAHVVSSAFIKSPTAQLHNGFSAGSYKDMTRVALLSPEMWTQLFLENKDNLLKEIDILIENMNQYKRAIETEDAETLKGLLAEGRRIKEEIDA